MPLATDRFLFGKVFGKILSSDIDNVQFRKESVFQSGSNKYFTFLKDGGSFSTMEILLLKLCDF